VVHNYSLERMANAYIELYEKVGGAA